jgi:hypothetical protein
MSKRRAYYKSLIDSGATEPQVRSFLPLIITRGPKIQAETSQRWGGMGYKKTGWQN